MAGFEPLTPCLLSSARNNAAGDIDDDEEDDCENKVQNQAKGISWGADINELAEGAHNYDADDETRWEGGLLYGDIHCYVFMRLYQKLYERLLMVSSACKCGSLCLHPNLCLGKVMQRSNMHRRYR